LLDGIVAVARDQVAAEATYLRYSEDDIRQALVDWWRSDLDIPPNAHPDRYWREANTTASLEQLAHVALRFITLTCREADIERLLCKQKYIQGTSGSNYRPETIHARLVLDEPG
jgi:hypothetical protein